MKTLIAVVFLGLCGLSAVAVLTQPRQPYPDKTHIVRLSDYHPRRSIELATFNRMYPDLWLTLDPSGNQPQKIIVQCSSGVGPDVFDVYGGTQLQTVVESGIVLDVTEEARQLGCSVKDSWPAIQGELTEQGRQYSYPANVNINILIFNKPVFDKLKVPYPKQDMTWDEFFELAKKVTRRAGVHSVFGVAQLSWDVFFDSQRGEYFSPDGTRLLINQEPLRKAFQMHHDMLYKHRVAPTSLELKAMAGQGGFGAGGINQFADGRFAMISVGKWALSNFRPAYKDQSARLKKWLRTSPRDEKSRPMVMQLSSVRLPHFPGQRPCYRASTKSTAVNAVGPKRRESVRFLQYLASKEYSEIINEGVDALPGNPKFANAGLKPGEPALSELEMHENTVKAMAFGYQARRSPFLLTSDVERVLGEQISRIESDPGLSVKAALALAQEELERLMQRNLDRDPKLRERYKQLTGSEKVGGQP